MGVASLGSKSLSSSIRRILAGVNLLSVKVSEKPMTPGWLLGVPDRTQLRGPNITEMQGPRVPVSTVNKIIVL